MQDFIPIPDNPEDWGTELFQLNDIKIGKYRVMYGFRLRAGYTDDDIFYDLDICCGSKPKVYEEMFNKICAIIKYNYLHNFDPFKDIPSHSDIKPYPKDSNFCAIIDALFKKTDEYVSDRL